MIPVLTFYRVCEAGELVDDQLGFRYDVETFIVFRSCLRGWLSAAYCLLRRSALEGLAHLAWRPFIPAFVAALLAWFRAELVPAMAVPLRRRRRRREWPAARCPALASGGRDGDHTPRN